MSRDSNPCGAGPRALAAPIAAALLALTFSLAGSAQDAAAPAATAAESTDSAEAAQASDSPVAREAQSESPAEGADEAAAASTAADLEDEKANMIICRSEQVLGTKIKRRRCATAAQWEALQRATANNAEEGMRQIRERSTIVLNAPGGPPGPGGN